MSKGGVTYTEVFNAYQALTAAGEKPTDRALLEHIGAGSMTTIIKHRKLVAARMKGAFGEGGFVSESLRTALGAVEEELQKIYEGKVAQAQADGEKAVQALQEKLAEFARALHQSTSQADMLKQDLEIARSLLDAEAKRTEQLRVELQTAAESNASLTATVEQLRERVAKAEQAEGYAKAQQKHHEERTREQMKADRRVHEDAIKQLQDERNRSEVQSTRMSERLSACAHDLTKAQTQLQSVTEANAEIRHDLATIKAQAENLHESLRKAAAANLEAIQELREKGDAMAKLRESNLDIQHRYDILAKDHHQTLARLQELEKSLVVKATKGKGKPPG